MRSAAGSTLSRYQRGSALIISLVFLLLLTMLGVGAMQSSVLQERMAGNSRDLNIAFQAAEAAARAGEQILNQAVLPTFDNSTAGYRQVVDTKGKGDYWTGTYQWNDNADTDSGSRKYEGSLQDTSAELPRFVIEELPPPPAAPGGSVKLGELEDSGYYRITARGVGATRDTVVIVQTIYKIK